MLEFDDNENANGDYRNSDDDDDDESNVWKFWLSLIFLGKGGEGG